MYKLMIVSRCIKDAKERSREVLDAYGLRVGQKTWNVKISETGKKVLISKLKKIASKNSSIAIYKYGENNPIEIIGSKKYFNNGQTSIETESEQETEESEENIHHQIYKRIISLAAYFHDIGKSEKDFQDFITMSKKDRENYNNTNEILKHEIVSFYILREFEKKRKGYIKNISKKIKIDQSHIIKENEDLTLEKIIRLLVVFHHKLGEQQNESFLDPEQGLKEIKGIPYSTYNVKNGKNKESIEITLSQEDINKEYDFYKEEIEDIKSLMEEYNIKINEDFFEYFFHYGRMAIIIADHHCSRIAKENGDEDVNASAYSKSAGQGRQKLQVHMKEVSELSKKVYDKLIFKNTNSLKKEDVKHMFEFPNCDNDKCKKYAWQKHGFDFMDKNHNRDNGLFCIISSSTGSGKTRFGASSIFKMSDNIRLTVALGLRNLTLQVGDSYREMTGLNEDKVKTQIGDYVTKIVFDENKKSMMQEVNEIDDEVSDVNMDYNEEKHEIEDFLTTTLNTKSKQSYYNTPVVISTIDYIIGATDYRTTSFVAPSLRLLTTDLLLDEVDGYDLEQFYSIIRLAYMTGIYGNKLYLSTATLIPSLIQSLYIAYKKGYEIYANMNKKSTNIDSFIISDFKKDEEYLNFHSNEDFRKIMSCFIDSNLKTEIIQYKVEVKDIDLDLNPKNRFEELFHESLNLASNNNEVYENGKKCSVGMIRVAHIKNGFRILESFLQYAKNKMDEDENLKINIVFYHSQMFSGVRSYLEKQMDLSLNRKGDKKLMDSVLFKKDIEKYNNVINIFIVTPVEEVGRDHDFDWAIIEPSSMRSIIQTAGRVNRHRMVDYKEREHNITLLNKNFSFNNNFHVKYSNPGFETEKDIIKDSNNNRDIENIAEKSNFDNIDVIKKSSTMSRREDEIIKKYLSKYLEIFHDKLSLSSNNTYLLKNILDQNSKNKKNIFYSFSTFRQEEKKKLIVYKKDTEKIANVSFQIKNNNERIENNLEDANNIYIFDKYNFDFIDDCLNTYLEKLEELKKLKIDYEYKRFEDIFLSTNITKKLNTLYYNICLGVVNIKD